MKHNKLIKVVSILLVLTYALGTGALASGQYPVFEYDYDITYVVGSHSSASGYYSTAWWWWDGAEAETRLYGSDTHAASVQQCYVYAQIENANKLNEVESDAYYGLMHANRLAVANPSNLSTKKATGMKHVALIKINGVYQWSTSNGAYQKGTCQLP